MGSVKSEAPEALSLEAKQRIWAWVRLRHPFFSKGNLREEWERCRDWHLSKGERRANWEAAFRNWLRKSAEFSAQDHRGSRPPLPSGRRVAARGDLAPGALEPLGELLRKIL